MFSSTGFSPSTTGRSRPLRLTRRFLTVGRHGSADTTNPTTPNTQPLPGITCTRFSLIRFRSPLLTESLLFSLPVGTEMFHFPTFPPHTLYIQMRVTRHHSCWVSPFGNPRITARLTAPRGISQPPTSFIGSWCQGIHRTLINTYNKDARVHCAVLKQHTTTPTARKPISLFRGSSSLIKHIACSLRTQQCTDIAPRTLPVKNSCWRAIVSVPPMSNRVPRSGTIGLCLLPQHLRAGPRQEMLLRKEVIQPHLPVRLPCYDFVPIADPTFDGSLPRGVRPPASGVTDFHDVTGGVYKARERIHRSVADLRLLATPTSRGRVADPDPN